MIKGHTIKGHILMSNYNNKHIIFNEGEYVQHLEPPIEDTPQSLANPDSPTSHIITMERMMVENVQPDTFKPAHHKLQQIIETKLAELLKE